MSVKFFTSRRFKTRLSKKYEELKGLYNRLVDEVMYILRDAIEKDKVKIHSLNPRETKIKTFKSFYDKVVSRQIRKSQFEAIEDIAGVRVICLYRSDLAKIGGIISKSFELIKAETSTTRTEAPFGYSSDHYVVKLPKECKGPRYDNIKKLKCEVQVRTIPMDAWASVSHHLDYKQEVDIPRELRTTFNALAGLFYVADTVFEFFRKGIEESRANLMKAVREDAFDVNQEINLDSLQAYMRWKYPERTISASSEVSLLVKELGAFGHRNLRQLDDKINTASSVLTQFEKEFFEALTQAEKEFVGGDLGRYTAVGAIRHSLDLTDDDYFNSRHPGKPVEKLVDSLWLKTGKLIKKHRSKLRS